VFNPHSFHLEVVRSARTAPLVDSSLNLAESTDS
jgi:hypothetical protein